jgi:hypothetical protein
MTNTAASREKTHRRLQMALAGIAIIVLAFVVPPLISVAHYKSRITRLIAQSLGRPVRLSSVKIRLLPWPGFVLYDLSVAEDPAYGAEPVLHASEVTASLRLLALWRGRLEIDKISVDEASLNVVRAAPGQWNLDSIFRTAAARTGASTNSSGSATVAAVPRNSPPLPTLEATNSRINFKNGVEKLPFALVNADLSLWQESPGEWRIRLRGQPARTDVSLYQEETGVVRMEASFRAAPTLDQIPVKVDLNWREAQLGQLARLITGSDPGWRGDVTGQLHVEGTADAAQVAIRLEASGVQRAEFMPASPLDFDANCSFVYHYPRRSFEKIACDSPLGDGRVRLTGDKLDSDTPPRLTVELDRIPIAAGLGALRTLRNGIDPGLEASGAVSGKVIYDAALPAKSTPRKHQPESAALPAGPLTGSLTVANFALTGGGLNRPVQAPKIVLEPSVEPGPSAQALTGTVAIPAGGDTPLAFTLSFSLGGYQVGVRGQASIGRARELAHAAGIPESQALASLVGDPISVDLTAAGPWLPPEDNPLASATGAESGSAAAEQQSPAPAQAPSPSSAAAVPAADSLTGTVTLRNANWGAAYLANRVRISEATLHLDGSGLRWDPVDFAYGPLEGTVSLTLPAACPSAEPEPEPCPTQFQMQFAALNASLLQSALLGADEKPTLLSDLIKRLHPAASPPWPALEGTVNVDSMALGPVTLHTVSAAVRILPVRVEVTSLDAGLFDGSIHLTGSLLKPATDQDKPGYTFEGDFQKLDVTALGSLLGLRWTGAPLDGNGKIELSGYTAHDLADSVLGTLHFECRRGAIAARSADSAKAAESPKTAESPKATLVPAALNRFDKWTADATIANGSLTLEQSQAAAGARKQSVAATVTFTNPPVVSFGAPKQIAAKR